MILFYRALLIIILSQVFCRSIFSQAEVSSRFLLFKPGEKANGMAGAYTASSSDAWAAYYNPAGLAGQQGISFVAFYAKPYSFFDDINHQYYAIGFPYNNYVLGMSLNYFNPGKIYSTTSRDAKGRYYAAISLSLAKEYKGFMFGVNGKMLQIKQFTFNSNISSPIPASRIIRELTFDVGFQKRQLLVNSTITKEWKIDLIPEKFLSVNSQKGISIGLTIQNVIGKEQAYDTQQSADLPRNLVAGIMYTPLASELASLELMSDMENLLQNGAGLDFIRTGVNARFFRLLSARGGYIKDMNGAQLTNFTYGFGVESKFFSINCSRNKKLVKSYWGWSLDARLPL